MDKIKNLKEIAKKEITKLKEEYPEIKLTGAVLYSNKNTLKKGDIYLLGYNPGGEAGTGLDLLTDGIETLERTNNAYLDEEWPKSNLQGRVISLLEYFGYDTKNVCASNLIFLQSRNVDELEKMCNKHYPKILNICQPVHQAILKIVKPKIIICIGNNEGEGSAYSYLKYHARLNGNSLISEENKKYEQKISFKKYSIKSFRCFINNKEVKVIGFPHLSRYWNYSSEVKDWIIQTKNWLHKK